MKTIKIKYFKQVVLTFVVVLSTFTSCKKDYFDINTDPNNPSDVSVDLLLSSAEAGVAHAVGNNFQISGGLWAQFWTQSPASSQYKADENYNPAADDFDRPWMIMYSDALKDLETIVEKGTETNQMNYVACAKILQAYAYQVLTDNFGDIPFSEALKGDEGILSPHYDSQQAVYAGLITLVDQGLAAINEGSDLHPHDDDLLLGGDMALWRKFGTTLKLRIYIRLSEVDPGTAQAGILGLPANSSAYLAAGEEVSIDYLNNGNNLNPLYSSIVDLSQIQNLVASSTAIDYMTINNDPRIPIFYAPSNSNTYVGLLQGNYNASPSTIVAYPGTAVGGRANDDASATAPVKLMTAYESLFLQSEASARGWFGGNAQALYEEAIAENFGSYGIAATSAGTYTAQTSVAFPAAGTIADKIEAIITQKWVAMNGNQADEAWIEWRRTGYPDFFVTSANSILGANEFPVRLFYPNVEVTRNLNFPGQHLITDRVWWDVN